MYFVSAKLHATQIIPLDPHLYVVWDPRGMPPVNWGREDAKGISLFGGLQSATCRILLEPVLTPITMRKCWMLAVRRDSRDFAESQPRLEACNPQAAASAGVQLAA